MLSFWEIISPCLSTYTYIGFQVLRGNLSKITYLSTVTLARLAPTEGLKTDPLLDHLSGLNLLAIWARVQATHWMQVSQKMGLVLSRAGDYPACLDSAAETEPLYLGCWWCLLQDHVSCIAPQPHKQTGECSISHLQDEELLLGSANSGLSGCCCFVTQGQRIPQDFTSVPMTKQKHHPEIFSVFSYFRHVVKNLPFFCARPGFICH